MAGFLMRSKLFVPGSRPELFGKALASAADAISIDLEDAVRPEHKAGARAAVAALLGEKRSGQAADKTLIVRVNSRDSGFFESDLDALIGLDFDILNLPKMESAAEVQACVAAIEQREQRWAQRGLAVPPLAVLANIESPLGLIHAADIARASKRVMGLQIGYGDLFEPLGIGRDHAAALAHVQLSVRFAAGAAGIAAYDGAYPHIANGAGFSEEAANARALGYSGKSCIHPSQIALANAVFQPSAAELAFSQRVLDAWRDAAGSNGHGAIVVDGTMVDAPYVAKAQAMLAMAGSV